MKKVNIRSITVCAIMSAISYILMIFEFPVSFLIPSFIQFDFSEIPALITSFSLGPVYGVIVCLVKNLLHLPFTKTSGVGELANFLLGAVFCFVAGLIYKNKKSRKTALIGCVFGSIAMAVISFPINLYITYPVYYKLLAPMPAVLSAYRALLPSVKTISQALLIFNMPFTLTKGIIDSLICFLVYKKLSPILKPKKLR